LLYNSNEFNRIGHYCSLRPDRNKKTLKKKAWLGSVAIPLYKSNYSTYVM